MNIPTYTKIPIAFLSLIITIILIKAIWMNICTSSIGSFESEKNNILKRCNWLVEQIIISPKELIGKMPSAVGPQFQGEWALYSCSMLCKALVNIAHIYPDTKEESLGNIEKLIEMVQDYELKKYDYYRWGEDPLFCLESCQSHISYLSHLAWMIGNYKQLGGNSKYDKLHEDICEAMNRRILSSPSYNLPTYPGEPVYVPDMLVAIVALHQYAQTHNGKYSTTVKKWIEFMHTNCTDPETGIISSFIPNGSSDINFPIKGSYSALSCYYLALIDKEFAEDQYTRLKEHFLQKSPIAGFKESLEKTIMIGFDIDAGPILLNLSPSGTAFGIGPATFFNDTTTRKALLKTAELAGSTITVKDKSHYLLANIALVGEAITLAMRTSIPVGE